MSFWGRIWRGMQSKEDPEKILIEMIIQTEEQLVELRRAVACAIAARRNIAKQLDKNLVAAKQWHDRARLAIVKGNEQLAKEALQQRQPYHNCAQRLETELLEQNEIVKRLKQDLSTLEDKIAVAKAQQQTYLTRSKLLAVVKEKAQGSPENDRKTILSSMEIDSIEQDRPSRN